MRILIVDDEVQIRRLVQTGLSGYGHKVITASNGAEAMLAAAQQTPDLILLDISLNKPPDGLEVCRRLREWTKTPIIMLSVRGEEHIKVEALDAGADDYLTKPFGMEELRARISAVLRRTGNDLNSEPAQITAGALQIDLANRRVTVNAEEVHLTPKEYDLLRLLALNPGKVITHRTLLDKVWGAGYGDMDHYVRVFINQIRKKLGEDPARGVRYIMNEPGIGYRFVETTQTE